MASNFDDLLEQPYDDEKDDDPVRELDPKLAAETDEVLADYRRFLKDKQIRDEYAEVERQQFDESLKEVERLAPDYVAPREEEPIEAVAVEAAADLEGFRALVEADIARQRAEYLKTQPGYDPDTGEAVQEVEQFDPAGLSKAEFDQFMSAVTKGYEINTADDWATYQRDGFV